MILEPQLIFLGFDQILSFLEDKMLLNNINIISERYCYIFSNERQVFSKLFTSSPLFFPSVLPISVYCTCPCSWG